MKVLISDSMSSKAAEIFQARGIEVHVAPKLSVQELRELIPQFDGLAVRSATKADAELLACANNLKVIGRAGIGVDNIDVAQATSQGIVVMNTPYGNAVTTAEHAIAMMFAIARQIPAASQSTKESLWEKSRFMGVELTSKTLGIIGCGNIGSIVAQRALGLGMKVVSFDPFLTLERAAKMGIKKVELAGLLEQSDFVTLHIPKTAQTENIINADAIGRMKKGAYLINCARGGLVDELALAAALTSGHLAGAALDVFDQEPARDNILFSLDNVVCTPHLGAATLEAQEKVAVQIAEQMSDYLLDGAITNALNAPSLTAQQARLLQPYLVLSRKLGSLVGQLSMEEILEIEICFAGQAAQLEQDPLIQTAVMYALKPQLHSINMVNALSIAKERGIAIKISKREQENEDYLTTIAITITTKTKTRTAKGTLMNSKQPRLIEIKGIALESELTNHMLYVTNQDQPGFIGALGQALSQQGINIASFHLGRLKAGGDAVSLIEIDSEISQEALSYLRSLPLLDQVTYLRFDEQDVNR